MTSDEHRTATAGPRRPSPRTPAPSTCAPRNRSSSASSGRDGAARGCARSASRSPTGPGGKATHTLIEAVFLDAFRNPVLERLGDGAVRGRRRARGSRSPPTPTSSRRCSSPAATSATSPSTAPSTTSRCAGRARCTSRRASSSRRASPVADLRRIVDSMAARRRGGGRADRHRRHQGRPARQGRRLLHHHRRGRASSSGRWCSTPAPPGPATSCSCPARSATTASRSCSPAASSTSRPTSSRTPPRCTSCAPAVLDAGGDGVRVLRDATRGGVATILNEIADRVGRRPSSSTRPPCPVRPRSHRRGRAAGHRPALRRVRGPDGRRGGRRTAPTRCWPRMRAHPTGAGAAVDRPGRRRPARPGAAAHRLRRHPDRRPARRRSRCRGFC